MAQRILRSTLLLFLAIIFLLVFSAAMQRDLPAPGGPYPVGRTSMGWSDPSRPEVLTEAPDDTRFVNVQIWYPAKTGTGVRAAYFPNLNQLREALLESGEVSSWQAAGLGLIRANSYWQADAAEKGRPFPVLLLSPGNGTNVEFYSALAEELASQGYVVVGLNHPYDVPAVALDAERVAEYHKAQWEMTPQQHQAYTQDRIGVRVQDALFVLEKLAAVNADDAILAGQLDLTRLGFLGHSLGGIAAAQACQANARFKACGNMDGIQVGGPFSAFADPLLPSQPFLFITKEEQLHPKIVEQFKSLLGGGYVVTVKGASHNHFSDGPLLVPSLLPFENNADRILRKTRKYVTAFFDQELKGEGTALLQQSLQDGLVVFDVY